MLVDRLSGVLLLPFLHDTAYSVLKDWVTGLCEALQKMVAWMDSQAASSAFSRERNEPARDPSTDSVCYLVDASEVGAEYKQFSEDLASLDFHELLDAGMYTPADRYKRQHWLDSLAASYTFVVHNLSTILEVLKET